ncbi:MAG: hypothetical protein OJF62_003460 [Pseudolabrys sp.]|jgi:hypothetical protein|nr:hypothetical protein [Pseudolabrys sp.]
MNYIGANFGAGGLTGMQLNEGYPVVTRTAMGVVYDGVVDAAGSLDLTKGWSLTAGFEHRWNPNWKTSLYGSYGSMKYSDAASATLIANGGGTWAGAVGTSADWDAWNIGTRTVWTPVENLDLSLDVLYTDISKSSFSGGTTTSSSIGTFGSKSIVSGIFRVQRNFWP